MKALCKQSSMMKYGDAASHLCGTSIHENSEAFTPARAWRINSRGELDEMLVDQTWKFLRALSPSFHWTEFRHMITHVFHVLGKWYLDFVLRKYRKEIWWIYSNTINRIHTHLPVPCDCQTVIANYSPWVKSVDHLFSYIPRTKNVYYIIK